MEIVQMYNNIKDLLEELCSFLSTEISNGTFKRSAGENLAETLISKTKSQLCAIEQMRDEKRNDLPIPQYLDMNGKKKGDENINEYVDADVKEELYSHPNENQQENEETDSTMDEFQPCCPFDNKLVADLCVARSGFLQRKELMFHVIGMKRRYFVAICQNWLLFYRNKRHTPVEAHLLKNCEIDESNDNEIFQLSFERQKFVLIATSRKDRIKWVQAIKDAATVGPRIKTESVESIPSTTNEAETIYEEVNATYSNDRNSLNKPPSLPPPNQTEEIYDFLHPEEEEIEAIGAKGTDDEIYDLLQPVDALEDIYDFVQPVNPVIEEFQLKFLENGKSNDQGEAAPPLKGKVKRNGDKRILFKSKFNK